MDEFHAVQFKRVEYLDCRGTNADGRRCMEEMVDDGRKFPIWYCPKHEDQAA